ncbi:hypothetical protein LR48_Vigan10g182000 [Vigna angularis]|uniref:BAG family molecular chaperone regulator 1 Bcl-2-associated athanogene 1 n=1 Tax=Phaseolus angularis TaxID=3914 RepID=A0A0L9VLR4_PHAAN|nr:BAG family molecular chaperone regulator 1 Bcl-2-associated athanogene 1 [Vigna angularis]KOM55928.1 hypothetical protein LR48_Vigan10g182000 [Vigna angularis]
MFGVKDKSKIVLVEDPISQEKRLLERRKNAKMEKAAKLISEINLEVDRLARMFIHTVHSQVQRTPLTSSQTPYIGVALRQWKPSHVAIAPSSRHHNTIATPPQHRRHTATEPPNRHKRPTITTHKVVSPNLAHNPQTAVNEPTKQRRREHHKIVETTTTPLIHGTSTMGKEREGELETRAKGREIGEILSIWERIPNPRT